MKTRTLDQVEAMKGKAARFVRDVLEDDARADEIADESPEDYAERKRIGIIENPRKEATPMPASRYATQPTRAELQERVEALEAENEELQDKLEAVRDAVADDDDEEERDDVPDVDGEDDE